MPDDAFGHMVRDYHRGDLAADPVHRRDDGETWRGVLEWYFADPGAWPTREREFVDRAEGRVLDLGCGVGRTARYLQGRGQAVVGVDRSPLACGVARERGLDRVVAGDLVDPPIRGAFDTVLAVGGQLGVPGSRFGLRTLLKDLADLGDRLVADLFDPTEVDDEERWTYLERRKIADGAAIRRFRVEYDERQGPWIDLLYLTPASFREIVAATPWEVSVLDEGEDEHYYVVLERD
ncbi:class I SAM-dependent methyltransferase [Halobacteriales archaeon QS_8_69_26]|nr:MAG: class I SAM-dependent methyltransferase [Halobacteriales archaeon QS_8_69_26]